MNGAVIARTFYRSNSQVLWRYLPTYRTNEEGGIDHYGKLWDEQTLFLNFETQLALAELVKDRSNILLLNYQTAELIFAGTARNRAFVTPRDKAISIVNDLRAEPQRLKGNFYRGKDGRKIRPERLDFDNPFTKNKPDFSSPTLEPETTFEVWSDYFHCNFTVETFISANGDYRYYFLRREKDGQIQAMVGGAEYLRDNPVLSTGVRKIWVDIGDLGTPLYEYSEMANGYGDFNDAVEPYVCMWGNYLKHVPLIQQYVDYLKRRRATPAPTLADKGMARKTGKTGGKGMLVGQRPGQPKRTPPINRIMQDIMKSLEEGRLLTPAQKKFFNAHRTVYSQQMIKIIVASLGQNREIADIERDIVARIVDRVRHEQPQLFTPRVNIKLRELINGILKDIKGMKGTIDDVDTVVENILAIAKSSEGAAEHITGQDLTDQDRVVLRKLYNAVLSRNSLAALYLRVKPGDVIVTFNQMQLKYLNTVLTMEGNNKVIAERNRLLVDLLKGAGLIESEEEAKIVFDWKKNQFVIKAAVFNALGAEEVRRRLNEVSSELSHKISGVNGFIDTEFKDEQTPQGGLKAKGLEGFTFTTYFGISNPVQAVEQAGEQDRNDPVKMNRYLQAVFRSYYESLQAAKMARTDETPGEWGYIYDQGIIDKLVRQAIDLRRELGDMGSAERKEVREMLETVLERESRERLEEYRKGRATEAAYKAAERLYKLKRYLDIKDLLLDIAMQSPTDFNNLAEGVRVTLAMLKKLEAIINPGEEPGKEPASPSPAEAVACIKDALATIQTHTADSTITSRQAFHYFAVKRLTDSRMYNGLIAVMDVEDFWIRIQDILDKMFDRYIAEAANLNPQQKQDKLAELALEADGAIKKLVTSESTRLVSIFNESGIKPHTPKVSNGVPTKCAERGGDEFAICINLTEPLDLNNPKHLDLLKALARSGLRVVVVEIDFRKRSPNIAEALTYAHAQSADAHAQSYTTAEAADKKIKALREMGIKDVVLILKAKEEGDGFEYYVISAGLEAAMPYDGFVAMVRTATAARTAATTYTETEKGMPRSAVDVVDGISELSRAIESNEIDQDNMAEYFLMVDASTLIDRDKGEVRDNIKDLLDSLIRKKTAGGRPKFTILIRTTPGNTQAIQNSGLLCDNFRLLDEFLESRGTEGVANMPFKEKIEAVAVMRGRITGHEDTPLGIIAGLEALGEIDVIAGEIENQNEQRRKEGHKNAGIYISWQEPTDGVVAFEFILADILPKLFRHDPSNFSQTIWEKLPPMLPAQCHEILEALKRTMELVAVQA